MEIKVGNSSLIKGINFRNRSNGWKRSCGNVCFTVKNHGDEDTAEIIQPADKNIFMRGFLSNLFLRPSCHICSVRKLKSGSDITLGDYWGIEKVAPEFDDDKGVSLVMVNSKKGELYFEKVSNKMVTIETSYQQALSGNPCIENSRNPHTKRNLFFKKFNGKNMIRLTSRFTNNRSYFIRLLIELLRYLGLLGKIKKIAQRVGL
ncbi:hypothetical protein AGMMS4952_25990 [Spirochaetia bacterium]|nr:hypothetical protein AGMMS4952_25990 [Spirochaetia bacterium]